MVMATEWHRYVSSLSLSFNINLGLGDGGCGFHLTEDGVGLGRGEVGFRLRGIW